MTRSRRWWTRFTAFISMLIGCAMIFGLLILMNAQNQPPEKEKKSTSVAMTVEKQKKKKKKPKLRPKPQRRMKSSAKPRAPLPNLNASISGVSFGLPQFDSGSLDSVGDDMLGGDESVAGMVMSQETVDVAPRPMMRRAPEYPPRARQKGITGHVTLSLLIGTSGQVERVKVLDAQPKGVFEEAAESAVRSWNYEPAMYKGEKVKVWARQILNFNLS